MTVVHEDKMWAELALLKSQQSTALALVNSQLSAAIAALGPQSLGAGAPAGTGSDGEEYWDTTNKRLYRSDGVGWIIMAEPGQAFTPAWSGFTPGQARTWVSTTAVTAIWTGYRSSPAGMGWILFWRCLPT